MRKQTTRRAPIYSDRLYLCSESRYSVALQAWEHIPLMLVSGLRKRRDSLPDGDHLGDCNRMTWAWDDGHLPEFRPRGTYAQACDYIKSNPYSYAYPVAVPHA